MNEEKEEKYVNEDEKRDHENEEKKIKNMKI